MKVGFINIQNGLDFTKGYWEYVLKGWKYFFKNNSIGIKKLITVINKNDLDFLGICEIDAGSNRTNNINQVELISKNTNLKYSNFFSTFVRKNQINQGNAIFSKYPITKNDNLKLFGKDEHRYVGVGKIELGNGKYFYMMVTHLGLKMFERKQQIIELIEIIKLYNGPKLLCGDFNIRQVSELKIMKNTNMNKVIHGKTFPTWKPILEFDHIFFSKEFKIINNRILEDKFSDHLMLEAQVKLC